MEKNDFNLEDELEVLIDSFGKRVYEKTKINLEDFLVGDKEFDELKVTKRGHIILKAKSYENNSNLRYSYKRKLTIYEDSLGYNLSPIYEEQKYDLLRDRIASEFRKKYNFDN
ncbi:MAG: hypothetical protein ACOCRX_04100 [Candidatus Woesearchaeota archaeon]